MSPFVLGDNTSALPTALVEALLAAETEGVAVTVGVAAAVVAVEGVAEAEGVAVNWEKETDGEFVP